MTRQEQDRLSQLANKLDIDFTTYSNYSGKTMYGRLTYAVTVDTLEDVHNLIVFYNRSLMMLESEQEDELTFEERLNFILKGHGKIFTFDKVNDSFILY